MIEKNQNINNSKKLLDELLNDIVNRYNIDKQTARKLINNNTLIGLHELKDQIVNNKYKDLEGFEDKKLEELLSILKLAREIIEKLSSGELKTLRNELNSKISNLDDITNIEDFCKHIEKYLPAELIKKAKDPKILHEQILAIALGTASSITEIAISIYKIGIGIIQTPYHLYLIAKGKATYDKIKEI